MLKGYHFVGANGDGLLWLLEEEGKQGIEEQRFTRYFINQTKMLLRYVQMFLLKQLKRC